MRTSLLCALSLPLLSASLMAQLTPVAPGIVDVDTTQTPPRPPTDPRFHPNNMFDTAGTRIWPGAAANSTDLQQLELWPIGGGVFRLAATITNATNTNSAIINAAYGTKGGFEVFEGTFDGTKVTLDVTAASLSTPNDEFALSISQDGLLAVLDLGTAPNQAQPSFATRASTGTAFGTPAPITGVRVAYVDPKLVEVNGVTHLAFINSQGGISMGVINRTTGAVTGKRVVIKAVGGTQTNHSPQPIVDANGELKAWIHAHFDGTKSDSYFVPGVDDSLDAPQKIWDGTGWQANPAVIGASGSTRWAWSDAAPNNYKAPLSLELVYVAGTKLVPGQSASITGWVPDNGSPAWSGVVAFGLFGTPLPIAGTIGNGIGTAPGSRPAGQLGLSGAGLTLIPVTAIGGNFTFTFPVPTAFPTGVPLGIQSVMFDVANPGAPLVMGNTATIQA